MSTRFGSVDAGPSLAAAGDGGIQQIPDWARPIAEKLALKHGKCHFSYETNGLHMYIPCPKCLEKEGRRELASRHCSINLERLLRRGKWKGRGGFNPDASASCMKDDTIFKVSQLLEMPPLEERGIEDVAPTTKFSIKPRRLIDDGKGNMIPEHPGEVVSILDLPPDHPAVWYLTARHYDLQSLWKQFRCSWCTCELLADKVLGRFYKRLPGGFRDTPQGRIIFYCDMYGVQQAWQARILDRFEDADGNFFPEKLGVPNLKKHWFWHPYQDAWVLVETKRGQTWELEEEFDNEDIPWKPSKYRTADSAHRNEVIFGLDAAIEWNRIMGVEKPIAFVSEGPLDAGKVGPPHVATIGKFLSPAQAAVLIKHFQRIVYVRDNDEAGLKALKRVREHLLNKVKLREYTLPEDVHDVGSLMPDMVISVRYLWLRT